MRSCCDTSITYPYISESNTKLTRFGFRDYDSDVGRWTAKDPIGFAGGNTDLMGYCFSNPTNAYDVLGLTDNTKPTIGDILGGAVSLLLNAMTPNAYGQPISTNATAQNDAPSDSNGFVQLCKEPADLPIIGPYVDHHWLKTPTKEAGYGQAGADNGVNLDQSPSPYVSETAITDHRGRSARIATGQVSCQNIYNVDEQLVNEMLEIGKPTGKWSFTNNCQSFAADVLRKARTRPYETEPYVIPEYSGY